MEKNDLNKKFFTEADVPVPIPAGGHAWEQMQNRLNKEMPAEKKTKRKGLLFFFVIALLFLTVIIFQWTDERNNSVVQTTNRQEEIKRLQDSSKEDGKHLGIVQKTTAGKNEFEKTQDSISIITNADLDTNSINPKLLNASFQNSISGSTRKKVNEKDRGFRRAEKTNAEENRTLKNEQSSLLKNNDSQHKTATGISSEPAADLTDEEGNNKTVAVTGNSILDSSTAPVKDADISSTDLADESPDTTATAEEEEKEAEEKTVWKAGVQLNVQIPVAGTANYFAGSNLKSQPYLLLVPSIWTSVQFKRSMFSVELNPYYTSLVPAKAYKQYVSTGSIADTIRISTEQRCLNKLIGTSFFAGFGYNIKNGWWLKGGLQLQWWRKGIATATISEQQYPVSNTSLKTTSVSRAPYLIDNYDWRYFNKFQVNPSIEVLYLLEKWEGALRIGMPLAPISNTSTGPKNAVRTELLLRYRLFQQWK